MKQDDSLDLYEPNLILDALEQWAEEANARLGRNPEPDRQRDFRTATIAECPGASRKRSGGSWRLKA